MSEETDKTEERQREFFLQAVFEETLSLDKKREQGFVKLELFASEERFDTASYFGEIARAVAEGSTCTRRQVGAIVVLEDRIVGAGYNGAVFGMPDCRQGACPRGRLGYDEVPAFANYDWPGTPGFCIAIHAEARALAPLSIRDTRGATVYVTDEPCAGCRKSMGIAEVARVVWPGGQLVGTEIITWNTNKEERE